MTKKTHPYSHTIDGSRLGNEEKRITLQPNEAERAAIAKEYEVDKVVDLTAELTVKPWRKSGARVVGKLHAELERTCVVTLEDFIQVLDDEIDRTFDMASSRPKRPKDLNEDGEIEIDLETLDPPDVMMDGVLDLGHVICEQLALSIDPFPRKPGASFENDETDVEEEDEPAPSPFAVLEKLKGDDKS